MRSRQDVRGTDIDGRYQVRQTQQTGRLHAKYAFGTRPGVCLAAPPVKASAMAAALLFAVERPVHGAWVDHLGLSDPLKRNASDVGLAMDWLYPFAQFGSGVCDLRRVRAAALHPPQPGLYSGCLHMPGDVFYDGFPSSCYQ